MATGQKISAMTSATNFSGSDELVIVQSGTNKSLTHDVLMADPQICQARVNFNGTGTPSIRDSYNVSSITDNGLGDYTVNFTNALDDTNYSVIITTSNDSALNVVGNLQGSSGSASVNSVRIALKRTDGNGDDRSTINVLIIGGV